MFALVIRATTMDPAMLPGMISDVNVRVVTPERPVRRWNSVSCRTVRKVRSAKIWMTATSASLTRRLMGIHPLHTYIPILNNEIPHYL